MLEALNEMEAEGEEDYREVLEAVLSLPGKYKDVIYLHYYEGYTAAEIGKILGKKENTVYSLLSRGRRILREKLGGDWIGKYTNLSKRFKASSTEGFTSILT